MYSIYNIYHYLYSYFEYFLLDIQEAKRIFGTFSNFGLAASMISVILGIIPLYTYCLQTGGI